MPSNDEQIDDNRVCISDHAVERFVERSKKLGMSVPRDPKKTLLRMVGLAEDSAVSPGHRVERLLRNGFQEAIYREFGGWRFVLSQDGTRLLTVERSDPKQN